MRTYFVTACALALAGCGRPPGAPAQGAPNVAIGDTPAPVPGGESFDSPAYKLWARFPVGTRVVQRTTTENEDNRTEKTVTTIAYTLKERTDELVAVESQATTVHYTGRVETNPPSTTKTRKTFTLPPGTPRPEPRKGEEGEEVVRAAGKEYRTRWVKGKDFTEGGELLSQTWTSDEMPGGLVRSVNRVPAKRATITVEVTEVTVPGAPAAATP